MQIVEFAGAEGLSETDILGRTALYVAIEYAEHVPDSVLAHLIERTPDSALGARSLLGVSVFHRMLAAAHSSGDIVRQLFARLKPCQVGWKAANSTILHEALCHIDTVPTDVVLAVIRLAAKCNGEEKAAICRGRVHSQLCPSVVRQGISLPKDLSVFEDLVIHVLTSGALPNPRTPGKAVLEQVLKQTAALVGKEHIVRGNAKGENVLVSLLEVFLRHNRTFPVVDTLTDIIEFGGRPFLNLRSTRQGHKTLLCILMESLRHAPLRDKPALEAVVAKAMAVGGDAYLVQNQTMATNGGNTLHTALHVAVNQHPHVSESILLELVRIGGKRLLLRQASQSQIT